VCEVPALTLAAGGRPRRARRGWWSWGAAHHRRMGRRGGAPARPDSCRARGAQKARLTHMYQTVFLFTSKNPTQAGGRCLCPVVERVPHLRGGVPFCNYQRTNHRCGFQEGTRHLIGAAWRREARGWRWMAGGGHVSHVRGTRGTQALERMLGSSECTRANAMDPDAPLSHTK
jgi:hypothetical protein